MPTSTQLKNLAIGLAAVWLVYKFGKSEMLKVAALGTGGVMIAKQIPYVNAALA